MLLKDLPDDAYRAAESTVAFRLFADQHIPTLTVPEQIAAKLGDRILLGTLPAGGRLAEIELSAEFQVSRGPVRDALRILEREGLVTLLARRGAIVTELTASELDELMEIRAGLFEVVIRKVGLHPSKEWLQILEAGTARLEQLATAQESSEAYAETTYRLILLCARLAGNQKLYRMLAGLSLQTLRYSKLGLASVERRQRSAHLWRQALQAQQSGDIESLVSLARTRIFESTQESMRLMSQKPNKGSGV
ncbi:MAG: putative HTH-type transcriptional regulator YdfH [Pseudomonadota bacterium]|jgi:DNA-binding GntR family transcriptional regulator